VTFKEAIAELKARGTEQIIDIYTRHGVPGDTYGVSFAHLRAVARRIHTDQKLAAKLWGSGNHDARVLATMVADPSAISSAELDVWARDLDNYILCDAFSGLAGKTPFVDEKIDRWCALKSEWRAAAGWNLVAGSAMSQDEIDNDYYLACLAEIESDIHGSPNRVRHAMNQALICIGLRNPALRKRALAAAKRIGRVEVDHGETGGQTPDAVAYIDRAPAHGKQQSARPGN
jgi:3-methyladenine DNA glycosylase AlkD